jgi:hypothetical protein
VIEVWDDDDGDISITLDGIVLVSDEDDLLGKVEVTNGDNDGEHQLNMNEHTGDYTLYYELLK